MSEHGGDGKSYEFIRGEEKGTKCGDVHRFGRGSAFCPGRSSLGRGPVTDMWRYLDCAGRSAVGERTTPLAECNHYGAQVQ
jgi:hypothetical protein